MSQLDRYIGLHVIVGTAFALAILLAVFTFIAFIDELGAVGLGDYTHGHAVEYVLLTTPLRAFTLFPIAAVVGSLMGLGVLASNRELTAVRASGVSVLQITGAVMKAALVLVAAAVLVGEWLAPRAEAMARERRAEALAEQWTGSSGAGFWARDGTSFINIGQVRPDNRLGDVTIYEFDDQRRLRVATHAGTAVFEDGSWRLESVRQSEIAEQRVVGREVGKAIWASGFQPDLVNVVKVDPESLSAVGLVRYIGYLRANGLSPARFQLALWSKLIYPVASAVMIFLTLPLVLGVLRDVGVGQRVVIGSMVGVSFHILHQASSHVGLVYGINAAVSAVTPTLAFLALGIWMMRRIN